jgi:1-deoxy-D-xylulose-5-phosphate reductoisomerase
MAGPADLIPVVILGATGSIGTQTLEVVARTGRAVAGIAARRGSDGLLEIAAAHPEATVAVAAPTTDERERFQAALGSRVEFGPEALEAMAARPATVVVNGVVGAAGLRASVAALRAGNRLALANKESLVAGGPVLLASLAEGGGELIPVDSEHSAIAQCLVGEDPATVRRLVLTASGGPFRGRDVDDLAGVTVRDALAHPTWGMGTRITIDSATLMNKAFEVIEAHHLFGLDYDAIDVVVHPQSIVHSMVEFVDGSVKAQLGEPDMRLPIQYAMGYPGRSPVPDEGFTLAGRSLTFEAPDRQAFPCLDLGYEAGRRGGSAPAVLNAADEVAVAAFVQGQIGFTSIPVVVERALEEVPWCDLATVDDVMAVDAEARGAAFTAIGRSC